MKLKAALAYFDLLQSQAEETIAEEALIISETLVRETEAALKRGSTALLKNALYLIRR